MKKLLLIALLLTMGCSYQFKQSHTRTVTKTKEFKLIRDSTEVLRPKKP